MRTTLLALIAVLFSANVYAIPAFKRTCRVEPLGGGQDDGPTINEAFKDCSSNSRIILDSFYSVDTLLLTTGLKNVDIELSGTCTYSFFP